MSMRSIIVPTGHLWMQQAFEDFVQTIIDKDQAAGSIITEAKSYSPWYIRYVDQAADILRIALVSGDLYAFYISDDGLTKISVGFWRKQDSDKVIRSGDFQIAGGEPEYVLLNSEQFLLFKASYEDGNWPRSSTVPDVNSGQTAGYVTPFMAMMLDAIRHFSIQADKWPKNDELVEFFLSKKLPDGSPLSRNHAIAMATFCRPAEAMKGGNKRTGC